MQVEMSLAESLINAIAHGKIHGVTFKRNTDEKATFADLQRVIGSNLDGTRAVAREQALRKLQCEHPHFKLRAAAKRVHEQYVKDGGLGQTLAFEDAMRALEATLFGSPSQAPSKEEP